MARKTCRTGTQFARVKVVDRPPFLPVSDSLDALPGHPAK